MSLTIHYGLLPRANRGLFAINELPDLAGKIQVGLFNILQEGDVQIKGYPLRFELDLAMVFTANPEDYTARGKIITPLKDRIGAEVRTHYPVALERRHPDHRARSLAEPTGWQESAVDSSLYQGSDRNHRFPGPPGQEGGQTFRSESTTAHHRPGKRGSNAEQRSIINDEGKVVARVSDVYAALPSITGKIELEYEGELRGAEKVAQDLIRSAVGKVFSGYFDAADFQQIIDWFDLGGTLKLPDTGSASESFGQLNQIQGLVEKTRTLEPRHKGRKEIAFLVSGCEFILDGLHAVRKIDRSEEKGYFASEKKRPEAFFDDQPTRRRKSFN